MEFVKRERRCIDNERRTLSVRGSIRLSSTGRRAITQGEPSFGGMAASMKFPSVSAHPPYRAGGCPHRVGAVRPVERLKSSCATRVGDRQTDGSALGSSAARSMAERAASRLSPQTVRRPNKNDTAATTRNTKNRILANPAASPAIPPKPRKAAKIATSKKPRAALNMGLTFRGHAVRGVHSVGECPGFVQIPCLPFPWAGALNLPERDSPGAEREVEPP